MEDDKEEEDDEQVEEAVGGGATGQATLDREAARLEREAARVEATLGPLIARHERVARSLCMDGAEVAQELTEKVGPEQQLIMHENVGGGVGEPANKKEANSSSEAAGDRGC